MHTEDTQRLVTEIEMLKVVLYLVSRSRRGGEEENKKMKKDAVNYTQHRLGLATGALCTFL